MKGAVIVVVRATPGETMDGSNYRHRLDGSDLQRPPGRE